MKINLNHLKFHSFKYNNKIHNLCIKKNYEKYFNNIFYNYEYSLKNILNKVREIKSSSDFKREFLHYHEISDDERENLINIIYKKHPTLFQEINQIFLEPEYAKYYQLKIHKSERLIFTLNINLYNEETFIPLIFDLNHCIYISKVKGYDNNFKNKNFAWNFKSEQEKIKEKLKEA